MENAWHPLKARPQADRFVQGKACPAFTGVRPNFNIAGVARGSTTVLTKLHVGKAMHLDSMIEIKLI